MKLLFSPSQVDYPTNPAFNFNTTVGFSSRFRLQTVISILESINRTSTDNRLVGLGSQFGAGS